MLIAFVFDVCSSYEQEKQNNELQSQDCQLVSIGDIRLGLVDSSPSLAE